MVFFVYFGLFFTLVDFFVVVVIIPDCYGWIFCLLGTSRSNVFLYFCCTEHLPYKRMAFCCYCSFSFSFTVDWYLYLITYSHQCLMPKIS
jgi:hypothetical protein